MKTKSKSKIINKQNQRLEYILFIALTLFIVFSQLFQGLYFRSEYLPGIICMGLIFIMCTVLIYKKRLYGILNNVTVIGLIGLFAAYVISLFAALSPMEALDSVLKQFSILTAFITALCISKSTKGRDIFEYGILLMGFILSAISLLDTAEIINIEGVITNSGRLGGVYQYANTNAIVMGAVMLFSILQLAGCNNIYKRFSCIAVLYLSSWAFWASESRGALLVILVLWLLNVLLAKPDNRFQIMLYGGFFLSAGAILYTFYSIKTQTIAFAYVCLFTAIAVFAAAWISVIFDRAISKINTKTSSTASIILIAGVLIFTVLSLNLTKPLELTADNTSRTYSTYNVKPADRYILELGLEGNDEQIILEITIESIDDKNNSTPLAIESISAEGIITRKISFKTIENTRNINIIFNKRNGKESLKLKSCTILEEETLKKIETLKLDFVLLPASIAHRIGNMKLTSGTFAERIVFMKDGLKVLYNNLLLGTGGGGWRNSYTIYQSYGYISAHVHNYYLQTAIETGIIGIAAMLTAFIGIFIVILKNIFVKKAYDNKQLSLFALMSALMLHSALDFNFSLHGAALLFWVSSGMLIGQFSEDEAINIKPYRHVLNGITVLNIIIIVTAFILLSGASYTLMGDKTAEAKPSLAKAYYKTAIGRDLYNTEPIIKYAKMLAVEAAESKNRKVLLQAKGYFEKALKMEPNKINNYQHILDFYMVYGFYKEASDLTDRLINIQPLSASNYELKTEVNMHIYEAYLKEDANREQEYYKIKVLEVEEQYKTLLKQKDVNFKLTARTLDNIKSLK